jgi:hypothetical protein
LGRAGWSLMACLAAFGYKTVPYWNWYGFSTHFIRMEAEDLFGKFFIGGLLAAALWNKWRKASA